MQRYKCHKEVNAAKIERVEVMANGGVGLFLQDGGYERVAVGWASKHDPRAGGYLVQYDDGYLSYSPAKAFEDGYSLAQESMVGMTP